MTRRSAPRLFTDITSLQALQVTGYVFPLALIPYLARVLEPTYWGALLVAQGLATWLGRLVEYGFNLSATRELARVAGDRETAGRLAAAMLGARAMLSVVAMAVVALSFLVDSSLRPFVGWAPWVAVYAIAIGFSPFWYFQASNMIVPAVGVEVAVRAVVTGATLAFVRLPRQGLLALELEAAGSVAMTAITMGWMYSRVPFMWPRVTEALDSLRRGAVLFLFRSSEAIYLSANTVILSFFAPMSAVSFYGGAERILRAAAAGINPTVQALYPRMSAGLHQDEQVKLKYWGMAAVVATSVLALGVSIWAPAIIRVALGSGYSAAVPILRVLIFVLPLRVVVALVGTAWLLPRRRETTVLVAMVSALTVDVMIGIPLAAAYAGSGLSVAAIMAEGTAAVALAASALRLERQAKGP